MAPNTIEARPGETVRLNIQYTRLQGVSHVVFMASAEQSDILNLPPDEIDETGASACSPGHDQYAVTPPQTARAPLDNGTPLPTHLEVQISDDASPGDQLSVCLEMVGFAGAMELFSWNTTATILVADTSASVQSGDTSIAPTAPSSGAPDAASAPVKETIWAEGRVVVFRDYETAGATCRTEDLYESKELVLYTGQGEPLTTTELDAGRITGSELEYCVFQFEFGHVPLHKSYVLGDDDPEGWRSHILVPSSGSELDIYVRWE